MTQPTAMQANSYELPLPADGSVPVEAAEKEFQSALHETILLKNVLWFCRLRWLVAAIFAAFGGLCLFPETLQYLRLQSDAAWPFVAATILILGNLCFLAYARFLAKSLTSATAKANLWAQILFDLIIITVVVHHIGSLETYAPFAYLFHVVLACIFFSRIESFIVTATASVLYMTLIMLEAADIVGNAGIYVDPVFRRHIEGTPLSLLIVASGITIWFVVWHLASHLSAMVRERDHELAEANIRLVEAHKVKTSHMLRTTHELKAPFSAIHANAQLLMKGYCGPLTDDALDVVQRISARCHRLAREIQEMLQLVNLGTTRREDLRWNKLDLAEILNWSLRQIQQVAEEREVTIERDIRPAEAIGVEDHLKMLFENILSNSLLYSHRGGHVKVRCNYEAGNGAVVTVEDHGIGIHKDKLPHIFDEYYRTDEAASHNKGSTGLGLAIVSHIAKTHRIRLMVQSTPGTGTKFTMKFGYVKIGDRGIAEKEVNNGVSVDSR